MSAKKIVMYALPSKYTIEPFGQRAEVILDNGEMKELIQVADDGGEHANWLDMRDFLLEVHREDLKDPEYIKKCLKIYKDREVKDELLR